MVATLMRANPPDLLLADTRDRSRLSAKRSALNAVAIWEWGAVERASTGLLRLQVGPKQFGLEMLHAADRVTEL